MDEGDQKRRAIDGQTEGAGRVRLAVEDAGWFLREHVAWPVEDSLERLGRRGAIGVFGGGGIAVAGVVAALVIAGAGGSGQSAGITEAFLTPQRSPAPPVAALTPAAKPKKKATQPTGPTLHGAPPAFSPAKDVQAGVADGKAVGGKRAGGAAPTKGGIASRSAERDGATARGSGASAGTPTEGGNEVPASTAKIGATPTATASAQARASSLATAGDGGRTRGGGAGAGQANGTAEGGTAPANGGATHAGAEGSAQDGARPTGPPAPKAAKKVARRFAEAFVFYEIGGVDTKVREAFNRTSTKQLSRSLLHRPPRQPATVKVPRAKVVNVVAGPSKGKVYTVSVSLLRVGVTSELRLEMERGVGKKWQVTNVLG